MQFILECTTLLHIDPSQVKAAIQKNAISSGIHKVITYPSKEMQYIMGYTSLFHIDFSQV